MCVSLFGSAVVTECVCVLWRDLVRYALFYCYSRLTVNQVLFALFLPNCGLNWCLS